MKSRVLVVDDDPALAEMLTIVLRGEGFDTAVVGDGTRALPAVRDLRPDVVLLDLMLPGMNGIDVCRAIRTESGVPIVMLTAKTDTVDIVLGLESGADDYIVKPFSPKELVARVRSLFRRMERKTDSDTPLTFRELEVDPSRHTVRWAGRPVRLTAKEFALLVALLQARGRVLSRTSLLEEVWGYSYAEGTRTVDVHVRRLREKIPEMVPSILTVKTLGYRIADEAP
jgi:two-component system response regulator MtrA